MLTFTLHWATLVLIVLSAGAVGIAAVLVAADDLY